MPIIFGVRLWVKEHIEVPPDVSSKENMNFG